MYTLQEEMNSTKQSIDQQNTLWALLMNLHFYFKLYSNIQKRREEISKVNYRICQSELEEMLKVNKIG